MSVTRRHRYACCEMNVFFFNVFINHFQKIHRNVLHKITIDLLFLRSLLCQSMRKVSYHSKTFVLQKVPIFKFIHICQGTLHLSLSIIP